MGSSTQSELFPPPNEAVKVPDSYNSDTAIYVVEEGKPSISEGTYSVQCSGSQRYYYKEQFNSYLKIFPLCCFRSVCSHIFFHLLFYSIQPPNSAIHIPPATVSQTPLAAFQPTSEVVVGHHFPQQVTVMYIFSNNI